MQSCLSQKKPKGFYIAKTIALFIILGAIMFFARKINWYDALGSQNNVSQV
jgi:inner membrane protein involved in colicin E2 resistance